MGSSLRMEEILKDKQSRDPNSITSLSLTHKALTSSDNVFSCLSQFSSLEKLDLAFNSLTSLEGLSSCVNLKWLSIVENKLHSLNGIQSLSKLTVLNAGKNKLKSMDEVASLITLRALILNDNEIVSISVLNQLKELNTLVLSRNPIRKIGESLVKMKSLTKLSLSNCQLETIGSSLKSCTNLKELRLAHNDIKILPAELAFNKKLQNLDLGNNTITRWSDMKVLSSIVDLKNLNLQGNPITDMEKVSKKILKLLPHLHIFNARPIDKSNKVSSGRFNDSSLIPTHELSVSKEMQKSSVRKNGPHDSASDVKVEKDLKKKNKKVDNKFLGKEDVPVYDRDNVIVDQKPKRKKSQEQDESNDFEMEGLKQKKKKTHEKFSKKDVQVPEDDNNVVKMKSKSKKSGEQSELDLIDDADASFADFFANSTAKSPEVGGQKEKVDKAGKDKYLMGGVVVISADKKKKKIHAVDSTIQLPAEVEVGMGGSSTWDDE
ncbi:uncharacterized protein LOC126654906 [Mercurialis annua]|uniref:uncharacterized protein LOC126654906 n=1 Tax=Mercurialis annua TaxID=3986 RepID=UPI00215F87ED|nr:uncharacterized protein LOC126654906 [Mercurialis annua]